MFSPQCHYRTQLKLFVWPTFPYVNILRVFLGACYNMNNPVAYGVVESKELLEVNPTGKRGRVIGNWSPCCSKNTDFCNMLDKSKVIGSCRPRESTRTWLRWKGKFIPYRVIILGFCRHRQTTLYCVIPGAYFQDSLYKSKE